MPGYTAEGAVRFLETGITHNGKNLRPPMPAYRLKPDDAAAVVACTQTGGTQDKLLLFYQQFLPMIPKARGDRPSPYCMQMYQRAIDRLKKAGQTQTATSLETQLAQLKASVPKM